MPTEIEGRWPPVYDKDGLAELIKDIALSEPLEKMLYEPKKLFADFYQGDVIRLTTEFPYLNEDAEPTADEEQNLWVILGDSCDFTREIEEVRWTQIPCMCCPFLSAW